MPSKHVFLCCPLLLPSIFPSIRIFSNESALHIRWPKYWSFSFNISLCNEHSGLISFRMDWLDLLAVQRTLKSLLQHHSSKAMDVVQWTTSHIHVKNIFNTLASYFPFSATMIYTFTQTLSSVSKDLVITWNFSLTE